MIFKSVIVSTLSPSLVYLHSNLVIFKFLKYYNYFFLQMYLHSNLVIFKLSSLLTIRIPYKNIYIPIWWYSNEFKEESQIEFKILFTFQSGDIQMGCAGVAVRVGWWIYIPIWWYSNSDGATWVSAEGGAFTFQSGDIQIRKTLYLRSYLL